MKEHRLAKANNWVITDIHARKSGDQLGLDTLLVQTVNDEY